MTCGQIPALDKRLPLGWCLFEEVLPGSRLPGHDDSEDVQPALLATDPLEQRDDLVLYGVVNGMGMPVPPSAVTMSAVSSIVGLHRR